MPWSPTQSFPHPLANVHSRNCKPTIANFVSYNIVDIMVWEGLRRYSKHASQKYVSTPTSGFNVTAPSILHRLHVPHTYLWLGIHIPVSKTIPVRLMRKFDTGLLHCYLSLLIGLITLMYAALAFSCQRPVTHHQRKYIAFLNAGPKPIYIGFGSIVVDNPVKLTNIIFEAVKKPDSGLSSQKAGEI